MVGESSESGWLTCEQDRSCGFVEEESGYCSESEGIGCESYECEGESYDGGLVWEYCWGKGL